MGQDFKKFIARGNVVDMAVGVIIGAAFTSIVTSMVQDLVNPVLGILVGGMDFSDYFWNLGDKTFNNLKAANDAGAPVVAYGKFLNAVIRFFIVAAVVFWMVRAINRIKDKAEDPKNATVEPPADVRLLTEIRDLLKASSPAGPT